MYKHRSTVTFQGESSIIWTTTLIDTSSFGDYDTIKNFSHMDDGSMVMMVTEDEFAGLENAISQCFGTISPV